MKNILKVLAVIIVITVIATFCACSTNEQPTVKLTLSDPNEKIITEEIIQENVWYNIIMENSEGHLIGYGSRDGYRIDKWVRTNIEDGYRIIKITESK